MIVYVESNFLLELALEQEQAAAAEGLLQIAEQGRCTLALPAFSLAEPVTTLEQRTRRRRELSNRLAEELAQVGRSSFHRVSAGTLTPLLTFLRELSPSESRRLHTVMMRVLAVAEVLPLDGHVIATAMDVQTAYGLQPGDAIVYASVRTDLRSRQSDERKLFVTRNWKDFSTPGLVDELHLYGCRYEDSFSSARIQFDDEAG